MVALPGLRARGVWRPTDAIHSPSQNIGVKINGAASIQSGVQSRRLNASTIVAIRLPVSHDIINLLRTSLSVLGSVVSVPWAGNRGIMPVRSAVRSAIPGIARSEALEITSSRPSAATPAMVPIKLVRSKLGK